MTSFCVQALEPGIPALAHSDFCTGGFAELPSVPIVFPLIPSDSPLLGVVAIVALPTFHPPEALLPSVAMAQRLVQKVLELISFTDKQLLGSHQSKKSVQMG